jgi:curved DNA-binding protein
MAERRDFYDILGVGRGATADEIQRAYRKLAREYHPDVNKDPGAEERFKDVAEAYDVLSDPDTRRRYDAFGHDFRQVPEGTDPDAFRQGRRRAASAGTAGTAGGPTGFEDIDLEDLFGGMFGRGRTRQRRGWGPIPGADQEAEIQLTVEEAYQGGRRRITVDGRTIEVSIPAGVTDGQRIRLGGQGGQGTSGAAAGDLYLVVRMAPHPRFRLDGRDVTVDLPLAPWEAALGTTVPIDTPGGGDAKVKVPEGTSSGKRLRLRGRGLPNPKGKPGDLFAEVRIMVPSSPSADERRLFEELGRVSTFDPRRTRR